MENDLSESDKLRKLQEETLSRIRLECSNVEAKNIEKEQGSTGQAQLPGSPFTVWERPLNPEKDKTIEEFKEGTSNLKKHLEELEIKLESGWFSQIWLVSRS